MSNDMEFGVLLDQELYRLVDRFKQYMPPKDFEKLIPAIHEAQTTLHVAYNKIKHIPSPPDHLNQERSSHDNQ